MIHKLITVMEDFTPFKNCIDDKEKPGGRGGQKSTAEEKQAW